MNKLAIRTFRKARLLLLVTIVVAGLLLPANLISAVAPGATLTLQQTSKAQGETPPVPKSALASLPTLRRGEAEGATSVALQVPPDATGVLWLRAGAFDPMVGEPALPTGLRRALALGQPGLRLVQFTGPTRDEWYQAMTKAGLEVITYVPDYGYLVWGDDEAVSRLRTATSSLRWSGLYHPSYALHPDLADPSGLTSQVEVIVQVYNHAGADSTVQAILGQAVETLRPPYQVLAYRNLGVRIASNRLTWLASLPDVVNVEPRLQYQRLDEVQNQIVAGNLNATGTQPSGPGYLAWLTGTVGLTTTASAYPIVDVTDDGIDDGDDTPRHPDFYTFGITTTVDRLIYNYNWTVDPLADGLAGHGNINASIVAGYNDRTGFPSEDANGYSYGLGVNPFGRVAGSKIFNNAGYWDLPGDNYTALISNTYALGGRISSNSWGAAVDGAYTTDSQTYDALVRDAQPGSGAYAGNQEIIVVVAAGNDGSGSNTVGTPGTAKNVITVGAAESYRPTWADGCYIGPTGADNAQDIIYFSSRGPTDDGRVKPDIVAPGTHIQGAASQDLGYDGSGVCDQYQPAGQTLYAASSGTSHSTPAIAGAASLVYRYYQDHFGGSPPSPAMVKAYMVNATRYLTGTGTSALPSNAQGYGEIHLGLAFTDTPRLVVDQSHTFHDSGQVYQLEAQVADVARPFRVTLAWSDAPGPTVGNAYVNNLDLAVVVGGQIYRGNVFAGGTSTTGGSADPRNNVESVFLPAGTSGEFTVVITATNVAGNGVPGNGDPTDQDFALVIYNTTSGLLEGTITDANTSAPIVGAMVQASSVAGTFNVTSGAGGQYSMLVSPGTYTVTASAYGYLPNTVTGVVVTMGTTIQNIALSPVSDYYVVSGTVRDANTNWPLYARIDISGYPTGTIWNNPVTGFYSVSLPEGIALNFTVDAWVAGYNATSRSVGPLTADRTENFTLTVNAATCNAPGYRLDYAYFQDFETSDGGYATSGTTSWAWGTPSATPGPGSAHSGSKVWATNLTGNYGNGEDGYITSPIIDLSAYAGQALILQWWQWLQTESNWDYVSVEVSKDGGVMWSRVYGEVSGSIDLIWAPHNVSLDPAYAVSDFRVRFRLRSDSIFAYPGWYVDDVSISTSPAFLPAIPCVPQAGGLVVGNVYDTNIGTAMVGTRVENDNGRVFTTTATADPVVNDSFYTLFSPAGSHVFTATMSGYGTAVTTTDVALSDTVRQDFSLPAGWLSATPSSLAVTIAPGLSITRALTLSNLGDLTLDLEAIEGPPFLPLGEDFEGGVVPPADWTQQISNTMHTWRASSPYAHAGAYGAYVPWDYDQNEWLLSPEIDMQNLVSATLSLWSQGSIYWCRDTYNNCDLNVWLVTGNPGDGDDVFVGRLEDSWTASWIWARSVFPLTSLLPGGPVRIGFQYVGDNAADAAVDDILLEGSVNVPWLSESPITGTVAAGSSRSTTLTFDAAGMTPGIYSAWLRIVNSTPYGPIDIPVTMTVSTITPTITGFSPTSGPVGANVTITGTNFTEATTVRFNGVSASFGVKSSALLTATVPSSATTGPIDVITSGGTATSASDFTVILPTLSLSDTSAVEGDSGTVSAVFTTTLSFSSPATVTVDYATANGTATAGSDYTAISGTLTFLPGATTRTISVPVIGDTTDEDNETFCVNLDGPVNATVMDGQGMGTILNDDPPPTVWGVTLTPSTAAQSGDPGATVTYTLRITNTGNAADTFTMMVNSAAYTTTVTPVSLGALSAGASQTVTVTVQIPANAANGMSDVATITVTSQTNPTVSAIAMLTTTASMQKVFLPLILHN